MFVIHGRCHCKSVFGGQTVVEIVNDQTPDPHAEEFFLSTRGWVRYNWINHMTNYICVHLHRIVGWQLNFLMQNMNRRQWAIDLKKSYKM